MRTNSGATQEAGIRKSWLFTQHEIFDWSPPTKLQFMDANGKIKWLNAAIESQFGVGDMPFREKFETMTDWLAYWSACYPSDATAQSLIFFEDS